ncbi:hypothetical protein LX64_00443 [Chitinophaga skermanii]|uniref:ABC-2 type transport system permease protein n=1 Tax=Chitinophaga skermanii TaxID=331697 RepID=A0A327R214_9BACT|nr:ABC transporter permease [Chitinophaga skermanii]RAJ10836.1 hypothetical protein LX64_00443 [Chitinophaga skermanii]
MFNLLYVEWLKVKKYKAFWIILGIFAVPFPIIFMEIMKKIDEKAGVVGVMFTAFPSIWQMSGFWSSINLVLLAMLVILMITNENTYRTIRQNIIDGWSREQFFTAKLLQVIMLSVLATIVATIAGIITGVALDDMHNASKGSYFIFYIFLQSLCYLSAALFIGLYVKRAALAIAIYFMYVVIGGEFLLQFVMNKYLGGYVGNFLPLQASDELVPFPNMDKLSKEVTGKAPLDPSIYLIATLVYIGLFIFLSYRKMKKADL